MNNYNNNVPNLSASDRIKDKKAKAIMKGTQKNFRANNCISRNIKFYKNGKIKHVQSYDLKSSLARGNVFCGDCNQKGLNCASFRKAKINSGNNALSEYWGGAFISGDSATPGQSGGFTVINSNISGNPGQNIKPNVISIPNNLNGNEIYIDPSNNLFDDSPCYRSKHMNYSTEKTYVVLRSAIPIEKQTDVNNFFNEINTVPGSCDDERNNYIRNSITSLIGQGAIENAFAGRIIDICCIREQSLFEPNRFKDLVDKNDPDAGFISDPTLSPLVLNNIGIFDVYIELFAIKNKDLLNQLLNYTPLFNPNTQAYDWGDLADKFGVITLQNKTQMGAYWFPSMIESIRIFQGLAEKEYNQSKYNHTKQNYMSCLENGTKNINLSLPYAINKPIVKSYCGDFSDASLIFTPTYPLMNPPYFDGKTLQYFINPEYVQYFSNCVIPNFIPDPFFAGDPIIVIQMNNDSLIGQGWAICDGTLSNPDNFLVYKEDGTLIAGGTMGGITSRVVNSNPLLLALKISSPLGILTFEESGYVIYQNNGIGTENPPIASSPRLYFKVVP